MTTENVGLMDLRRASRPVTIQGKTLTVKAVSTAAIASALTKFPTARKMMKGAKVEFTFESLLTAAPDFVAFLIAAGFDQQEDKAVLEHVAGLGLSDQLALFEGVVDATLEGGMAPFVARVTKILGGFGVALPVATDSPTGAPLTK